MRRDKKIVAGGVAALTCVCGSALGQGVFDVLPGDAVPAAAWEVSSFGALVPSGYSSAGVAGVVRDDPAVPRRVILPPDLVRGERLIRTGGGVLGRTANTSMIGRTFEATSTFESGSNPPDTMGAVGPDHIVVMINGRFEVYLRDGTQVESRSLSSFLSQAGLSAADRDRPFDPRVLYDAASGRWYGVIADFPFRRESSAAIVVSGGESPTPASSWTAFRVDFDTDGDQWMDFPTLGMDADALYVWGNMFGLNAEDPFRINLLVVPKAGLTAATPTIAGATLLEDIDVNDSGFAVQPALDLDGGGLPTPTIAEFSTRFGVVAFSEITGTATNPSVSVKPLVPVRGYVSASPVTQPPSLGNAAALDASDSRFGSYAVLQNGDLWAMQTVDVGGRASPRWLRLDPETGDVRESGTISSPFFDFTYGSLMVTETGEIVVGGTITSEAIPASAGLYVGRVTEEGTEFGPPVITRVGLDRFGSGGAGQTTRWGDYSRVDLDPSNPGSVWVFQQFVLQQDIWAIEVTEVIPGNMPLLESDIVSIGAVAAPNAVFDISLCGSGFDTEIALWDGFGRLVATNDDAMACFSGESGLFGLSLPEGEYYLGVTGGSASFGLGYETNTTPGASGGSVAGDANGTAFGGTLEGGGALYYKFQVFDFAGPPEAMDLGVVATDAETFTIEYCASDFDAELGLWNELGELVETNDDAPLCEAGPGIGIQGSAVEELQLEAGRYYLSATNWETEFGFGFTTDIAPSESGTVSGTINGAPLNAFVAAGVPTFFTFEIEASEPVVGCNSADIAVPFGLLNSSDINAFVTAFLGEAAEADLAVPFGVLNSSDINAFVTAFLGGCP